MTAGAALILVALYVCAGVEFGRLHAEPAGAGPLPVVNRPTVEAVDKPMVPVDLHHGDDVVGTVRLHPVGGGS